MPARDHLMESYSGYPSFGALHPIVPTREVYEFMGSFVEISDSIFEVLARPTNSVDDDNPLHDINFPHFELDGEVDGDFQFDCEPLDLAGVENADSQVTNQSHYDPANYYKPYDPTKMWVGVLEAETSAKAARQARSLFEGQDLGAMENDARSEASRKCPNIPLKIMFDGVMDIGARTPIGGYGGPRSKLALKPNFEEYPETKEVLFKEFEIITGTIQRRLKQKFLPPEYTPHTTFVYFRQDVKAGSINEITKQVNELLAQYPLHVPLKELIFPTRLQRKQKNHR